MKKYRVSQCVPVYVCIDKMIDAETPEEAKELFDITQEDVENAIPGEIEEIFFGMNSGALNDMDVEVEEI